MREIIFAMAILFMVSAAFSYSYIPQIVSGNFDIVSKIENSNKSDFILLIPANWSITNVQYYGNLTGKEILLKNFHGEKCLALHLSFNSRNVKIYVNVHPSSNGYVYLYNIKSSGSFERKVEFVRLIPSTIAIPFLLLILPFIVFFSHERLRRRRK